MKVLGRTGTWRFRKWRVTPSIISAIFTESRNSGDPTAEVEIPEIVESIITQMDRMSGEKFSGDDKDFAEFMDRGAKAIIKPGDDSWGALPHDEFRLFPGDYTYTFQLRTFRQEAGVRVGLFSSQKQ